MAEEKKKAEEERRKVEEAEEEDEDKDEEEDEEKKRADEVDAETRRKVLEWEAEMVRLREELTAAAKAARVESPTKGVSREKACLNCRSRELVCSRPR